MLATISFRAREVEYCLDVEAGNLRRGDERIDLAPQQFDLLRYLLEVSAQLPGRLITYEEIFGKVWRGKHVNPEALSRALYKLRNVLGDRGAKASFLETVRGRGVRVVAEVNVSPTQERSAPANEGLLKSRESPPARANLTNFVDDVGEDTHLNVDIIVNQEGKCVVFYNRPLRVQVVRLEYFVEDNQLTFLSDRYTRQTLGLPLPSDVAAMIVKATEATMVRLDARNNDLVVAQFVVPLKVYQSSPPRRAAEGGKRE